MKKRFAVIGHPLGHTMSPFIHERMFQLSGIVGTYEAIATPPDRLSETVEMLKSYDGFNITIPHKQTIIPLLDELGESAEIYRAVNTVANQNGRLIGHSTDADGFTAALALEDIPLCGHVLICGAGGVSRTIATECIRAGCQITFAVQESDLPTAEALCRELIDRFSAPVSCKPLSSVSEAYDLAVNGTPVGMYPHTDAAILTEAQLANIPYLFDAVYNPENTRLVTLARSVGAKAISGMGMLVMQAAKAQEHWYGAHFEKEDMRRLVADANAEMRRLFQ